MVIKIYSNHGILVSLKNNVLYSDDKIVAVIENVNKGIDIIPINITGTATKLEKLGWFPKFSIDNIINDTVYNL